MFFFCAVGRIMDDESGDSGPSGLDTRIPYFRVRLFFNIFIQKRVVCFEK